MPVYMPKCVSQAGECGSVVMPDRLVESEQASWGGGCLGAATGGCPSHDSRIPAVAATSWRGGAP